MKLRNILILIVVAAVLAAAAVFSRKGEEERKASGQLGHDLFPDLDVNAVIGIEMVSPNSTVAVARGESGWVVPQKFGYPADFGRVKEFLLGLTELKRGMPVPANDDDRASLQLLDPAQSASIDEGSAATRLTLYSEDGSVMQSLLVGKSHEGERPEGSGPAGFGGFPSGRYIDIDGTVYLLSENLSEIGQGVDRWLEKQILNIPRSEILHVSRTGAEIDTLTISRDSTDGVFALQELATNETTVSHKIDNLTGALSFLSFSDVADTSLSPEETGLATPALFTARTANGKVVTVKIGGVVPDSETRYASLSAEYEAPPQAESIDPTDEEAAAKRLQEQARVQQEVTELNATVASWVYILESYTVDRFLTKREDLLEPPPEPGEDDTEATGDGSEGALEVPGVNPENTEQPAKDEP